MRTKKLIFILSVIVAVEFIVMTGICICDVSKQYTSNEPNVTVRICARGKFADDVL